MSAIIKANQRSSSIAANDNNNYDLLSKVSAWLQLVGPASASK